MRSAKSENDKEVMTQAMQGAQKNVCMHFIASFILIAVASHYVRHGDEAKQTFTAI